MTKKYCEIFFLMYSIYREGVFKNMKKILSLVLIGFLCFALVGCGNKDKDNDNNNYNNENNNTNNGNNINGNQHDGKDGRLVSGIFSVEYPKGWEWKNNDGDPEAHDPNENAKGAKAFVQLTTIGSLGGTEDKEAVKVGNYTFYSGNLSNVGSIYAPVNYFYEHNSHTVAMFVFYQMDVEAMEAVLSTFKVNQ